MDKLERTQPDGPEQPSSEPHSGLLSPHPASWVPGLAGFINQAIASVAVIWHGKALITLATTDARPLLGGGIILLTAALGARPKDMVAAIKAWRMK